MTAETNFLKRCKLRVTPDPLPCPRRGSAPDSRRRGLSPQAHPSFRSPAAFFWRRKARLKPRDKRLTRAAGPRKIPSRTHLVAVQGKKLSFGMNLACAERIPGQ